MFFDAGFEDLTASFNRAVSGMVSTAGMALATSMVHSLKERKEEKPAPAPRHLVPKPPSLMQRLF